MKLMGHKMKQITAMIMILVSVFALTGCGSKKAANKQLQTKVLTMNETDYTLADLMYVLYTTESEIDGTVSYYSMFGMDYWEAMKEEGKNKQETVIDSFYETARWILVMSDAADKAGYKLTDAESKDVNDNVDAIYESLSKEYLKRTGFTKEYLTEQMEKETLAYNYYMDQLKKIDIGEDDVKDDYPYEDYREYEIEYIFAPTVSYDEEGNEEKMSKDEIAKAKEKIDSLFAKVQTGASLEKAYNKDESVEHGVVSVVKDDEGMPEEVTKAALTLKNGQVYEKVVKAIDGYYIIKMKNDNIKDGYKDAIEMAIDEEKEAQFEDTYQGMLKKFNFKEHKDAFKSIELGNYTFEHQEETEDNDDTMFEEDAEGQE